MMLARVCPPSRPGADNASHPATRPAGGGFLAPSILLLTLVVAILPVLEAGSEGSPKAFEAMNLGRQMMGQKKIGESGKFVTLTQNEYQAVWGGYSDGPEIAEEKREAERRGREWLRDHPEEVMEKLKQMGQEMQGNGPRRMASTNSRRRSRLPRPLLGAYFGFVILALILGYALPPGRIRTGIFAGTVLSRRGGSWPSRRFSDSPVYHQNRKDDQGCRQPGGRCKQYGPCRRR